MSTWTGPGPDPVLTRNGSSPSDDRRSAYGGTAGGGSGRGGYYNGYGADRGDGYNRDWDEWERRRTATRGRSRSPVYDDGRRKRRGSFSPSDRDRYEPRGRYEDDYRGGRPRSPGYRNSRYPDPYESDCPVPMRSFIDWFQYTHPDEFADDERATQEASKNGESTLNVGIKGRYEKYRKVMISKQMDLMFRYHIKSPWFNEKYNPSTPFVNLRLRVRREGWKGLIDNFLLELEEGKHDPAPAPEPGAELSTNGKVPHLDEPESGGDAAVNLNEAEEKTEERGDEELPSPVQDNRDNGVDDGVETATMVGDNNGVDAKFEKPDLKDRIEPARRDRNKDDEITVEPEGNQVLIRTIPPDIGRVKLEKICRNVPGFVHLALGDTMQKRNYYRAGWIKFSDDADMTSVIDRLSEEKIEGFKLHVTHSTRPFSARARYAPETCRRGDRVAKDLENVKKLATLLENEAAELRKLPEKLPEPSNLPRSQGGDLPDETNADGTEETSAFNDNKAEPDEMAVDDDPREPKNRGSVAVEQHLAKLVAEMNLEAKSAEDGDGDTAMVEEAALKVKKDDLALDLYLAYLRAAFNCCYYCSAVTDHIEELQRKCVKHIRRRPASSVEPLRDERWEESLDQKTSLLIDRDNVDPREHGGKSLEEETSRAVEPHIKQEDEGKFRCITCSKLFKAMSFVEKHVASRHSGLIKAALEDIPFYNNFALDPHKIQPFTHVPPPNTNGQSAPPEAFGLRIGAARAPPIDSGPNGGRPRGNSYNSSYGPPPYAGGGAYYPPPPGYDPYYRDYYYPPPMMPQPGYPPPRGYGGPRSPPRGGRLSDRVGGFAPYDGLPPRPDTGGGGGRGGRGRRDSITADPMGPGAPGGGAGGGAPPPGAREDPRAAAGRKVSYYDIDRTAEGDVELTY